MQLRYFYVIDLRPSVKARKQDQMTMDSEQTDLAGEEPTEAAAVAAPVAVPPGDAEPEIPTVMELEDVSVFYGTFRAVRNVSMPVYQNEITAMIGPSGCGKSTVLRTLNRMNDLIPTARVEGRVSYLSLIHI